MPTLRYTLLLISAAIIAHCAQGALVFSTTTGDGLGTDAYIYEDAPNVAQSNGDPDRLRARSLAGTARNMYLRFDLNDLLGAISADSIGTATLTLTAGAAGDIQPNTIVGVYAVGSEAGDLLPINPTTFTWNDAAGSGDLGVITNGNNNSPLATYNVPGANPVGNPLRFNFPKGQQFVFTGDALAQYLRSDTNGIATLIVQYQTDNVGSSLSVASEREGTPGFSPTLTVVIPEPSTYFSIIGGVALAAFVVRRRLKQSPSASLGSA